MKFEHRSGLLRVVVKSTDPHKFWGVQYEDGHSTSYDWGPIENAKSYEVTEYSSKDPKPTDWTYRPNPYPSPYAEELKKGHVVEMRVTTVYDVKT